MAVLLILLVPSGAAAATVVNGDFESGTLSGWNVDQATEAGNWFAYKGTVAPIGGKRGADPVQAPPQGAYAGVADEANPDTLILYQDIALEAGYSHRLSLLAYYNSYEPIAIPTPDTLSVDEEVLGGQSNQQYRIDVMRPEAPVDSVNPADILRTLFQTKRGDPAKLLPTKIAADLTPFAGQTVRLRIAVAAHEEVLNAGVDAVSVVSTAPGQAPPHGSKPGASIPFRFGKVKANRQNGTAVLPVQVPGPGLLSARGKSGQRPTAARLLGRAKGAGKPIKPVSVRVAAAGTFSLLLKPTASALVILKQRHRLRVSVVVTYRPNGGSPRTASLPVVLKLEAHPRHRR